jgi:heterodisulfide reductase subunit A-like polyferredoxin
MKLTATAKPFSAIPLPAKTEVLVIGGGYTGTTAAIRLRQAGVQLALIDMEKLWATASARNGGMTLTVFITETHGFCLLFTFISVYGIYFDFSTAGIATVYLAVSHVLSRCLF